jgi:hypothetical protein
MSTVPLCSHIAFEEVDDGVWTLWYATTALARYDERHRSIHPIASQYAVGRSASFAGSAPISPAVQTCALCLVT